MMTFYVKIINVKCTKGIQIMYVLNLTCVPKFLTRVSYPGLINMNFAVQFNTFYYCYPVLALDPIYRDLR